MENYKGDYMLALLRIERLEKWLEKELKEKAELKRELRKLRLQKTRREAGKTC